MKHGFRAAAIDAILEQDDQGLWWVRNPSAALLEFGGVTDAAQLTSKPATQAIDQWEVAPDHKQRVLKLLHGDEQFNTCLVPSSWFRNPRTGQRCWFAQWWERLDARHMRISFLPLAAPDNLHDVQRERATCTYCGTILPMVGARGHHRSRRVVCDRAECVRASERDRKREWRLSKTGRSA